MSEFLVPFGDPQHLPWQGREIDAALFTPYITEGRLVIRFTDGTQVLIRSMASYEDSALAITEHSPDGPAA